MKYKNTLLLIFVVYFIVQRQCYAQSDVVFKNYTDADGLSSNSVLSIARDRKGFIWVGTEDGLNRFDGYGFRVFRNVPGDSTSLEYNIVTQISEDIDEMLWILYGTGVLNCFDPSTEIVTRSSEIVKRFGIKATGVQSFFIDSNKNYWINYKDGRLLVFDPHRKLMAEVLRKNGNLPGQFTAMHILENKKLWFHNHLLNYGINIPLPFKLNDGSNTIEAETEPLSFSFSPMMLFQTGGMLLSKGQTIYLLKANGDTIRKWPITTTCRGGTIFNAVDLWIGSHDGLYTIRGSDTSLHHLPFKSGDPHSVPMAFVNCLLSDHQKNLWIGTYGGLSKIEFSKNKFRLIKIPSDHPDGYSSNRIRSLVTDRQGGCWMGVEPFGLWRYHKGKFKSFNYFSYSLMGKTTHIIRQMFILEDTLYYNGWYDGLKKASISDILQSRKGAEINPIQILPAEEDVNCFYILANKVIWAGGGEGLKRISPEGKVWRYDFALFDRKDGSVLHKSIRNIVPENDSVLWIGSGNNGLYHIIYRENNAPLVKHFLPDPEALPGIGNNTINGMLSRGKDLWFATYGAGIFRLDKRNWTYKQYTTSNGLPNNVVYGIVEDENEKLWLSSNRGIVCFDPASEKFNTYSPEDGLQGYEYNFGASSKDLEGKIYFGGTNGLNCFQPDSIFNNTYAPQILFTGLQVLNRPVFPGDLTNYSVDLNYLDTLNFLPGQNTFSFEFTATNFINSNKNQFAYMLEGLDTTWQFIGTRRFISFTTIPPGMYTLHLKASNNDQLWSTHVRKLVIHISPFFYETLVFKASVWLLSIATLGALAYFILRVRRVKRGEQQRLRNQLKKDLHDDLKSDLSAIQNQAELIEMVLQRGDSEKAKSKAEEIAFLTRNALSTVDDLSWAFGTSGDTMAEVSGRMKNFIISIMPDSIKYEIAAPKEEESVNLPFLCKKHFYLIFKECIQNLKRHSRCTLVKMEWGLKGKNLFLMVSDNGIGFDIDTLNHKNGILHMKERARDAGGKLEIFSSPGKGTRIHLEIPIT